MKRLTKVHKRTAGNVWKLTSRQDRSRKNSYLKNAKRIVNMEYNNLEVLW